MKKLACPTALLALLSLASGCTLYFGDDDGDDDCLLGDAWYDELRDPSTGVCQSFGGGGGCGATDAEAVPAPDWASCYTACEGLDELTCIATPGCRGAYLEDIGCGPGTDCLPPEPGTNTFYGCWGTAPSGPVQGSCDGLDAQECSRHDDCIAVYSQYLGEDDGVYTSFSYCAPEPWNVGCYSDADCPGGYECTADTECLPDPNCQGDEACPQVCYGRCVPSSGGCEAVDCGPGYHCELQCYPCDEGMDSPNCESQCDVTCVPDYPTCDDGTVCPEGSHCETVCSGGGGACDPNGGECPPDVCWSECVPDVPDGCAAVDCAPGYHCEENCTADGTCTVECVADGVPDPGSCTGDVLCDSLPPACPPETTPGIANGCWTGYCIPLADCGPNDPGSCYGEVACDMAPPTCPEGTTPGIRNLCYTGYCIPLTDCDQTLACEGLDEAACTARLDCTALYTGGGCTCDPNGGCVCDEWTFDHCTSGGVVLPPDPMPLHL